MIRHTGGTALGAMRTRSRSLSYAIFKASWNETIPSCSPSSPTRRTSLAWIASLVRSSFEFLGLIRKHLHFCNYRALCRRDCSVLNNILSNDRKHQDDSVQQFKKVKQPGRKIDCATSEIFEKVRKTDNSPYPKKISTAVARRKIKKRKSKYAFSHHGIPLAASTILPGQPYQPYALKCGGENKAIVLLLCRSYCSKIIVACQGLLKKFSSVFSPHPHFSLSLAFGFKLSLCGQNAACF